MEKTIQVLDGNQEKVHEIVEKHFRYREQKENILRICAEIDG